MSFLLQPALNAAPVTQPWTIPEALEFCEKVYQVSVLHDFYPALTGGLLYKDRKPRKDIDIVFYSKRQTKRPNRRKLLKALEKELDLKLTSKFNWLQKATTNDGKIIDFFFPETKKLAEDEDDYRA